MMTPDKTRALIDRVADGLMYAGLAIFLAYAGWSAALWLGVL